MATQLRKTLRQEGVTQRRLAEEANLSPSALSRKIAGRRGLSINDARRIAGALSSLTGKRFLLEDLFPADREEARP